MRLRWHLRRAEDTAARERESRKAIQAHFDALNEEHKRLKAEMSLPVSSAHAGASDSGHLQLRVRSLLRENAECHAQIRLLGAEVFASLRLSSASLLYLALSTHAHTPHIFLSPCRHSSVVLHVAVSAYALVSGFCILHPMGFLSLIGHRLWACQRHWKLSQSAHMTARPSRGLSRTM